MKLEKKLLATLLLVLFLLPMARAEGIKFQNLSLEQALNKAEKEGKKIFIDVYATWCGPCKYLSSSVFPDEELGEFMNENFICLKLDGEKADGESLMLDFDLGSYPTMLFLSPEKALLKMIVGAVGPDRILSTASDVLHPEEAKIFQLEMRYEKGERDRDFLLELINERRYEEIDAVPLAIECVKLYPNLDLEIEDDFLLFYLTSDNLSDSYVQKFLASPAKYRELHEDLSEMKMTTIIGQLLRSAVDLEDISILEEGLKSIYAAYKIIYEDDSYSESELLEALKDAYNEEVL